MYVRRFEWERGSRTRATLALIQEALLTAIEPVPNVEFVVMTDDKVRSSILSRIMNSCDIAAKIKADFYPVIMDRETSANNCLCLSWIEKRVKIGCGSCQVCAAHAR